MHLLGLNVYSLELSFQMHTRTAVCKLNVSRYLNFFLLYSCVFSLVFLISVAHLLPIVSPAVHLDEITTVRGITLPKTTERFTVSASVFSSTSLLKPLDTFLDASSHPSNIVVQFNVLHPVQKWLPDKSFMAILKRNSEFLSSNFKFHSSSRNNDSSRTELQNKGCFYSGYIEGNPDSIVTLNICNGLHGTVAFSMLVQFTVHSVPSKRNMGVEYLFVPFDSTSVDFHARLEKRQVSTPEATAQMMTVYVTLANDPGRVAAFQGNTFHASLDMFFYVHNLYVRLPTPIFLVLRTLLDMTPSYEPAGLTAGNVLDWWNEVWQLTGNGTDAGYLLTTALAGAECREGSTGVSTGVLLSAVDTPTMGLRLAHAVGHTLGIPHDPAGCYGWMQSVPTSAALSTCGIQSLATYLTTHNVAQLLRPTPDTNLQYLALGTNPAPAYAAGASPYASPYATAASPYATVASPYATVASPYATTASPYATAASPYATTASPYATVASPYASPSVAYAPYSSPYVSASSIGAPVSSPYASSAYPYATSPYDNAVAYPYGSAYSYPLSYLYPSSLYPPASPVA